MIFRSLLLFGRSCLIVDHHRSILCFTVVPFSNFDYDVSVKMLGPGRIPSLNNPPNNTEYIFETAG